MSLNIFAIVGHLKKPKTSFIKKLSKHASFAKKSKTTTDLQKNAEMEFMTQVCFEQQREIENLKKEIQMLKNQYQRANRQIYQQNAPKVARRRSSRRSGVRPLDQCKNENSFSIIL